jgi:predicted nucleotide-binding protein
MPLSTIFQSDREGVIAEIGVFVTRLYRRFYSIAIMIIFNKNN